MGYKALHGVTWSYMALYLCCSSARQSHAFDEGIVAWRVISKQILLSMISIVYGSPAAGSGNKRAASIGGLGRRPAGIRTIFANWLYQLPTLPPSPLLSS
jgi:hypothetical protein